MIFFAVLLSAILYRIPRGGPDEDVWKRWIGFAPGSRLSTSVWAAGTAGSMVLTLGLPWWVAVIAFVYLTLAEMQGYMKWVSEDYVDVRAMTLRGLLLLNPLMGVIYEGCRLYGKRLPIKQPFIDGWTAYAELFCGLATACGVAFVLTLIGGLI